MAELKADSLQRALESPFQANVFQRAPEQSPLNLSVTEVPGGTSSSCRLDAYILTGALGPTC